MGININSVISKMTLEDKADLCSGAGMWNTCALPEQGIPSILMTDGPHGLRRQKDPVDYMGINESVPATCFPTAAGLACSWNRDLLERVGIALGEECQAEDVQILLGPGANIKRSPLCGRNFEYFSEDPYLSSQLAASHIKGVQSQGVGVSLKHFAANNQETHRFNIDTIVDERTLREIYLASFEGAVVEAQPWTVMCAYNKINGEFCSQNKWLLNDVLREEWGFDGFVVSDWFAVSERDAALSAGMDLEMPQSAGIGKGKIIKAVENGSISMETLNASVERILKIVFKARESRKKNAVYDKTSHHMLAKEAALESVVLLKNDGHILPLEKKGKIALIGAFVKNPTFQGTGSSRTNPTRIDIPYEGIRKAAKDAEIIYAEGYSLDITETDDRLIREAKEAARKSDVTVIFAGLTNDMEGTDRKHMRLPDNQNILIDAVSEVQKNVVVVLMNGSAIEMPWINSVSGVIEAYLGGQAMAGAVADLIFGDANPSGKLAETFPGKLSNNPSYINFPGESGKVEYREGLFVGYRYYDMADIKPLFPFGYGLSYTTFVYSDLKLDKQEIFDTEEVQVAFNIKNTGNRAGKETAQIYVRDVKSSVMRPVKELKGFEKISLEPGEEKRVTAKLSKRSFAYYNAELKDWHVESGEFEILIGESSQNILLRETITVKSSAKVKKKYSLDSTLADVLAEPAAAPFIAMMEKRMTSVGLESYNLDFSLVLDSIKLRSLAVMSEGTFTEAMLTGIVKTMNEK